MAPAEFAFDRCIVRPEQRQVLIDGRPVAIGARAFDVLLALFDRRDRVVGKNELLDVVWPGLVVEENNLQVHISALRKLLGPCAIATLPGRGYRFAAALRHEPGQAALLLQPDAPARSAALTNLPTELPLLHGRERDLAALRSAVAQHRLVTISGAGGIGKTRLAQAAALQALGEFADGVWWVDLAPVSDAPRLLGTVARTLGIPLDVQADTSAGAQALAARMADRHLLLVLDNCEHLLDGAAEVAQALLNVAARVSLLATSQEPLKLAQEHVVRLGTLAVPSIDEAADAGGALVLARADDTTGHPAGSATHDAASDSASDGNALSLFEARSRAAQPRFALHAGNLAAAIDICRRLDGIPLAIELAAARLPLLGLEGLRQRLDDRFKLLTAGARLAPRRQQTLRAALEWSHALLRADEQVVFRRLGIFRGSFGLDAAQRVATDNTHDEWAVLDHLGALVDKSLVVAVPGPEPRYRLLESARAFALERLHEAGEAADIARRHADTVLDGFTRAHEQQWTASPSQLAAQCLPDLDNLRAALAWAAGPAGDAGLHVGLAGASAWLWKPAALNAEGVRACVTALERLDEHTPAALQARLLYGYASLAHQEEAHRELAALQQATSLYGTLGDRRGRYLALTLLSQKQAWRYDLPAAEAAANEAADLYDDTWPPALREGLLTARTYCFEAAGRPADGQPLMEELVALMRRVGDARQIDFALMQLAESLFVQGKAVEAVVVRREVMQRIGPRRVDYAGTNLANLSAALTHLGELDEATALAHAALPSLRRTDRLMAFHDHFALLAAKRRRHADAARALGRSDAIFQRTGFDRELSEQRARNITLALLQQALPGAEIERLLASGAALSDEEAVRLALDG